MEGRRGLPYLWIQECCFPEVSPAVAVQDSPSEGPFSIKVGTVFEDSPLWLGQVARGHVDGCELQERN